MANVFFQSKIPPLRDVYAFTYRELQTPSGDSPEQLIGLVPFKGVSTDERPTECFNIRAFDTDKAAFLFILTPSTATGSGIYYLEKWDGTAWVDQGAAAWTGLTEYLKGSFTGYPNYGGFTADWDDIITTYGAGYYRFVVDYSGITPLYSPSYRATAFNANAALMTVYVEAEFSGFITNYLATENSADVLTPRFLLGGNTWVDYCRYDAASFGLKQAVVEVVTQPIKDNFTLLAQQSYKDIYELKVTRLPNSLYKRLKSYGLASKSIKLTAYTNADYTAMPLVLSATTGVERGLQPDTFMVNCTFDFTSQTISYATTGASN